MSRRPAFAVLALVLLAVTAWSSVYTVGEDQVAARLDRHGTVLVEAVSPGLHCKWPWGVEAAAVYDRRVQSASYSGESFATRDGRNFKADLLITWRVRDAAGFRLKAGGSEVMVADRLANLFRDAVRNTAAQRTLPEIVGADAELFAAPAYQAGLASARELGVEWLDARITRIDLGDDQNATVYKQMTEQLGLLASQLREDGSVQANKLRADAEGKRAALLAAATRDSQHQRGAGDAEAAGLYARAYGHNPEFANFYRSLQGYRNSIGKDGDVLVVYPDGEFFRYLRSPSRREAR